MHFFQMYGEDYVDNSTSHRWIRKYREANRLFKDHACSRHVSKFSHENLNRDIANSHYSPTEELVETFYRQRITVKRWMQALGFINITTGNTFWKKELVTLDDKYWTATWSIEEPCIELQGVYIDHNKGTLYKKFLLSVWWEAKGMMQWEYFHWIIRSMQASTANNWTDCEQNRHLNCHDLCHFNDTAKITGTRFRSFSLFCIDLGSCIVSQLPFPIVTLRLRSPSLKWFQAVKTTIQHIF